MSTSAPRVLVAYGSKFGSTAEIAEAIGDELAKAGMDVDVRRAGEVRDVGGYDAVVLGSAVYMARWRRDAARLLRRRRRQLGERPLWLFSSGPVGEQDKPDAERWTHPKLVEQMAGELKAREHVVFGGAVSEGQGGFTRKAMARNTPAELRDMRDWDEIRAWAATIAEALKPPAAGA